MNEPAQVENRKLHGVLALLGDGSGADIKFGNVPFFETGGDDAFFQEVVHLSVVELPAFAGPQGSFGAEMPRCFVGFRVEAQKVEAEKKKAKAGGKK